MSWDAKAACKGEDTERFHSDNQTDIKWALDMCAGCPVKAECLKRALEFEDIGIQGGMTARGRARLKRRTA